MIECHREQEFLDWLRGEIKNSDVLGAVGGENPVNPRVSAMREAGGVDYRHAEAQSVAFQVEFPTLADARKWSAERFSTLAARFEEKFGPQAMVFVSLFEEV